MTLLQELKEIFRSAIATLSDDLSVLPEITDATQERFGHYQCNDAMKLAKVFKTNPREVAQRIVDAVIKQPSANRVIERCEIAGPGFINIWLKESFLLEQLSHIYPAWDFPLVGKGKKVIVDYSSPNTAKEMHVGHLRSTIIGDSIASLMETLGYDVLRLNHIGDWGTAFGMLIAYIKQNLNEDEVTNANLTSLVDWYKKSKVLFDNDSEFKKLSQLEVVALQGGDEETLKLWKRICEISSLAYGEIYKLLGVSLRERGESFYNKWLPEVIEDLSEKKLLEVSEGAKCVYLEGFTNREGDPLPFMVQKSDGGYNYATTDLAALKHRVSVEKADRIIIVTDAGQATHFSMLFKAGAKAGYVDPEHTRLDHVPFGLVLGEDGKKFKTRSGEVEKLSDLLQNAISKARNILDDREELSSLQEEEKELLAKSIGINAVKYADLSSNRLHDYKFSYDRMLQFEGNTAPFLMYAYVRIRGIQRKSSVNIEDLNTNDIVLTHDSEKDLILHIGRFQDVLLGIHEDLMPNRLCEYLYELSEKFNRFFRDCRVVGDPNEKGRLLLSIISGRVFDKGMRILGLSSVDRM